MPTMTAYANGVFCWPELGTTDQKAAHAFYKELFDWSINEMPMPDGSVYAMMQKGSEQLAASYQLSKEMLDQGIPTMWMSYVAVDDADATAAKVTANGGRVMMGPMDVKPDGRMFIGRMAVVQDPEGATFSLWQAGSHIGATLVNEHGSLCWNELWSRDVDGAAKFYQAVFGWSVKPMEMDGKPYRMAMAGDRPTGGIMTMPAEMKSPPNWITYFAIDAADKRIAKAKAAGAKLFMGPEDVPGIGRIALLQDPQGAVFGLVQLA